MERIGMTSKQVALASLSRRSLFLKTHKLPSRPIPQLFQDRPHLWQLVLQPHPRAVVRPLVQLLIYLTLQFARLGCRVLAEYRGHKFDIKRCLHKGCKGVAFGAGAESRKESEDDLFEEIRDCWEKERGCRRGNFGVDVDEEEEGFVDVGAQFGWPVCCGDPGG